MVSLTVSSQFFFLNVSLMEGLPYYSFSCMIKVCRLYSVHIAHEVTGESNSNSIQFQICLSCIAMQIEILPEMGLGLDSSQGLRCNRAGCNTNLPSLGSRTGWATYCRFLDSLFREAIKAKKSQNCGLFPYGGGGLNPIP